MFTIRVSPSQLIDRLNAESNSPEFIANASVLSSCELNLFTLKETVTDPINNSIRNVTSELNARGATIPMFRPADIDGWWLNVDTAPKLTKEFEEQHRKARIKPGDIVLSIAGTIGTAARVPSSIKYGNINGSSARIPPKESIAGYLLAYLNSNVGNRALLRLAVGSVQKHLNLEDLPNVPVPLPNNYVQNYIGNKVRQAEQLRDIELIARKKITKILLTTSIEKALNIPYCRYNSIPVDKLYHRLDSKYYNQRALEVLEVAKSNSKLIYELIESVTNGFEHRTFSEQGTPYLTVSEISTGRIELSTAPLLDSRVVIPQKTILNERCVLVVRTGSIGYAAKVHPEDIHAAISSHLIKLELKDEKVASCVAAFLSSPAGKCLLHKISYGAVQPQIGQDELLNLPIPENILSNSEIISTLESQVENAHRSAKRLVCAAKILVEALIEGHLTESELEAAQQALENGDNSLDKAILARLTAKGMDIEGKPPLFPDLDALYQLLAEAEAATDTDAEAKSTDEQTYATS